MKKDNTLTERVAGLASKGICATGKWHPTCIKCDVELNKLVATWAFGKKTADMLIQDYERR